jgi:hypothetical protein
VTLSLIVARLLVNIGYLPKIECFLERERIVRFYLSYLLLNLSINRDTDTVWLFPNIVLTLFQLSLFPILYLALDDSFLTFDKRTDNLSSTCLLLFLNVDYLSAIYAYFLDVYIPRIGLYYKKFLLMLG